MLNIEFDSTNAAIIFIDDKNEMGHAKIWLDVVFSYLGESADLLTTGKKYTGVGLLAGSVVDAVSIGNNFANWWSIDGLVENVNDVLIAETYLLNYYLLGGSREKLASEFNSDDTSQSKIIKAIAKEQGFHGYIYNNYSMSKVKEIINNIEKATLLWTQICLDANLDNDPPTTNIPPPIQQHSDSNLQQIFDDAYDREGGKNILGDSTSEGIHCWASDHSSNCANGVWIQDFRNGVYGYGGYDGHSALIYSPSKNDAFVIRDGFWQYYAENKGYKILGTPIENEYTVNGITKQCFEKGCLVYTPATNVILAGNSNFHVTVNQGGHRKQIIDNRPPHIKAGHKHAVSIKNLQAKLNGSGDYEREFIIDINDLPNASFDLRALLKQKGYVWQDVCIDFILSEEKEYDGSGYLLGTECKDLTKKKYKNIDKKKIYLDDVELDELIFEAGKWYVLVVVKDRNTGEIFSASDEKNERVKIEIVGTKIDLELTNATSPTQVLVGENFDITAIVTNLFSPAPESPVIFYLMNGTQSVNIPALASRDSATISMEVTASDTAGSYEIMVCAEATNDVNTANNCQIISFEVIEPVVVEPPIVIDNSTDNEIQCHLPQLGFSSKSSSDYDFEGLEFNFRGDPTNLSIGQSFSAYYNAYNDGKDNPTTIQMTFYLTDCVEEPYLLRDVRPVYTNPIRPDNFERGDDKGETLYYRAPNTAGRYVLTGCIDGEDDVDERNEDDNCMSHILTVKP